MGQTPSKEQKYAELYSSYIQQQQNLIQQQQNQLNSLYQMNMIQQNQNMMTPSMVFQANYQNQQNSYQQPQISNQIPKLPKIEDKQKINPYKILNISKDYDLYTLKKAYLKAAMKCHPDRGGSPEKFQQLSIAYALLTDKLKNKENSHLHDELRDSSKQFMNTQENTPMTNVNMSEKFDIDVFNKIYQENRIQEAYDDGYGNWMNKNPVEEVSQTKLFQNGFNKDLFNATFEDYKKKQAEKMKSEQVVEYQTPESQLLMKNKDALVVLGQGKITDFSGTSDNLQFTDYKKAYTDGTLINVDAVSLNGRPQSMNSIKSQRSNIQYQMNEKEQQYYSMQAAAEQQSEKSRIERLNQYDNASSLAYDKIHSLLLHK